MSVLPSSNIVTVQIVTAAGLAALAYANGAPLRIIGLIVFAILLGTAGAVFLLGVFWEVGPT